MRLFVAIELTADVRRKLGALQSELKQRSSGGRFVPVESMHITMHFIGESRDLAGAVSAIKSACRDIRPFTLKLGRYGCFDRRHEGDRSRTAVVTVEGELKELNALYESLECALGDNGFARSYRRFVPHITLGRNVEHDDLTLAELASVPLDASMQAQGLTLFESIRVNGRMVYNPLHRESF